MDEAKNKKEWKEYEELIYKIYKELEPVADVKLNDFILGYNSFVERQIDVSIRSKIASHEILIIVQAKNYKKRADVTIVDQFSGVIQDVRASKGILICNSGFTKTAKEYAQKLKIDLCTAHDASNKNWQTEIQIPVIKKSITVELKIQHHYVVMTQATINGITIPFPEQTLMLFLKKWENDEISKEPGVHHLALDEANMKLNANLLPIKNGIEYKVVHRHHLKFFKPIEYRGIKDYITEKFTPTFMTFNENIPFSNDGTWNYIENPEDISIKTLHLNIELLDIGFLKKKMIRFEWEKTE